MKKDFLQKEFIKHPIYKSFDSFIDILSKSAKELYDWNYNGISGGFFKQKENALWEIKKRDMSSMIFSFNGYILEVDHKHKLYSILLEIYNKIEEIFLLSVIERSSQEIDKPTPTQDW
jgi:hypothetical protein